MVSVIDTNDNAPVFSTPTAEVTISDRKLQTPRDLYQVTATDADLGQAAQITYSLSGGRRNLFSIDSTSGMVMLDNKPPPGIYILTITAIVGGTPPLTTSMKLKVTVIKPGKYMKTI